MIEGRWSAGDVVIVAGGPSLKSWDIEHARGRAHVIVVNDGYRLAPWADALYAADGAWWDHHQGVRWFPGLRVTQDEGAASRWGLTFVESADRPGLSLEPTLIHQGSNSGYQAVNLAVHLMRPYWPRCGAGSRRILLLGFDMKAAPDGRSHWFGDHPGALNRGTPPGYWAHRFETMAPQLAATGIEIINCSRDSAITCFPRAAIDRVLNK